MEIVFSDSRYLWFLTAVFILLLTHSISFGWSRKRALRFANFEAISWATRTTFLPKSILHLLIRIFILVFMILAAAGLGIWYNGTASDFDYMVIIDASGSMLAQDYEPNRLGAAKESASTFVELLNAGTYV